MISTVTKLILIGIYTPHCTSPSRLLLQCLPLIWTWVVLCGYERKCRITEFLTSAGNLIKVFLSSDCLILCEFVTQFFLSTFYLFLHIISQIFRLFCLSSVAAGMHWTAGSPLLQWRLERMETPGASTYIGLGIGKSVLQNQINLANKTKLSFLSKTIYISLLDRVQWTYIIKLYLMHQLPFVNLG